MMRNLKELEHYKISATDGDVGKVVDFLFDDERWVVRHLVVETGGFFNGHKVLISPISFRRVDWASRQFHLALTMDQIKQSPSVDTDEPVSRQHEYDYYNYYGYPCYWGYAGAWGMGAYPGMLATSGSGSSSRRYSDKDGGDVHLRSAREVRGYHIHGTDGNIGHVVDFIVDDETWEVRYMVVDTSNWWLGNKVLVAPKWVDRVSWAERNIYVDMSRQSIKDSPKWTASASIPRDYEARLYAHYGRPVYWAGCDRDETEQSRYSQHA